MKNYDSKAIMKEMMDAVVSLYQMPGDSGEHMSLRAIGEQMELSPQRVRKFLITAGVYESDIADIVRKWNDLGKTVPEIMEETGLSRATVNSYLPYSRPIYKTDEVSDVAERLKDFREKEKNFSGIRAALESCTEEEQADYIWDGLYSLRGMPFLTILNDHFYVMVDSVEYVGDGYRRADATPGTDGKKYRFTGSINIGKHSRGLKSTLVLGDPDAALKFFKPQYAKGYVRKDGTVSTGDVLVIMHEDGFPLTRAIPVEEVVRAFRQGRNLYLGSQEYKTGSTRKSVREPVEDKREIGGEYAEYLYPVFGRMGLLKWKDETYEHRNERENREFWDIFDKLQKAEKNGDEIDEELEAAAKKYIKEQGHVSWEPLSEDEAVNDEAVREQPDFIRNQYAEYKNKMKAAIEGEFADHPERLPDWNDTDEAYRTIFPLTVYDFIRGEILEGGIGIITDEAHECFSQEYLEEIEGYADNHENAVFAFVECTPGKNGKKLSTREFLQRWLSALCKASPLFDYRTGDTDVLQRHIEGQLEKAGKKFSVVTVLIDPQFLCKRWAGRKEGYAALGEAITVARQIWDTAHNPLILCSGSGFWEVVTKLDGGASVNLRWRSQKVLHL